METFSVFISLMEFLQLNLVLRSFLIFLRDSLLYYFTPLRVFHSDINWCYSTGVWVTANQLKFSGLFSVFWPILIMLSPGLSPLVLLFPNLPVSLPILWGLFQVHQFQLVSLSPSCSIDFSSLVRSTYLSLFLFSFFTLWFIETATSTFRQVLFLFFFLLSITRFGHLAEIR